MEAKAYENFDTSRLGVYFRHLSSLPQSEEEEAHTEMMLTTFAELVIEGDVEKNYTDHQPALADQVVISKSIVEQRITNSYAKLSSKMEGNVLYVPLGVGLYSRLLIAQVEILRAIWGEHIQAFASKFETFPTWEPLQESDTDLRPEEVLAINESA